ncbi:MAG: hypothetical protein HRU09_08035 [Oligoflexales bacterium]|nr:hypothetical protein [Oligoflexales bacterium]
MSLVFKRLFFGLVPRPASGSFGLDIFYIILIISFQVSILPSLLSYSDLDLLTPWLVFLFIGLGTGQAMLLALLGAIALENHGTFPAGLYFCSYWIMGTLISLLKKHISWRNTLPWIATFTISQLWIVLFETFVFLVKTSNLLFLDLKYGTGVFIRMLTAFVIGVFAARFAPFKVTEEKPT